jgi:hypothetical protein
MFCVFCLPGRCTSGARCRVCTPNIRREASEAEGVPQRCALQKDLIYLGVTSSRHVHSHCGWAYGAPQGGVDRVTHGCFCSELTVHGIGTDPSDPCRLTDPTGLEAHVHARVLPLGHTPCAASVALCVTVRVATFHDLLMMTMRALDRDACQRPPLPAGHCQAEAQCDITLSPSPRVEHNPYGADVRRRGRWARHEPTSSGLAVDLLELRLGVRDHVFGRSSGAGLGEHVDDHVFGDTLRQLSARRRRPA